MKCILVPGQGQITADLLTVDTAEKKEMYALCEKTLGRAPDISNLTDHEVHSAIIVANGIANALSFLKAGGRFHATAGYSIGQIAALAIAGVITPKNAIFLAVERARLMKRYSPPSTGMLSVIGLTGLDLDRIMETVNDPRVSFATINSEFNMTISGPKSTLEVIASKAIESGAKQVALLEVEGAWHSPLLEPALPDLRRVLETIPFSRPEFHFICNATGQEEAEPIQIRTNLERHLVSPVQWKQSMATAKKLGINQAIECGAGQQLKKILFFMRLFPCHSMNNPAEIQRCAEL